MKPDSLPDKISYADFNHCLDDYPQQVQENLQALQQLRYHDIPEAIARRAEAGKALLEKTQLQSLVEWKLKHGTYRPTLAALIASNRASEITHTTFSAFSAYSSTTPPNPSKAITTLCKLKGVGPATASLILSCYDPFTVPFFSDELFRWLHWEDGGGKTDSKKKRKRGQSGSGGWDIQIKYTAKEYASIFEKTTALRERLGKESGKEVKAVDVERVAYGICKRDQALLLPQQEEEVHDSKGNLSTKRSPSSERDLSPKPSSARKRRKTRSH
ncbi:MAG: hypothetical protein LQ338_004311 [Usnochroma carphineum]|nr:MAG: hypothetical protein LQ338_004311 [Usnochroma carphineum]